MAHFTDLQETHKLLRDLGYSQYPVSPIGSHSRATSAFCKTVWGNGKRLYFLQASVYDFPNPGKSNYDTFAPPVNLDLPVQVVVEFRLYTTRRQQVTYELSTMDWTLSEIEEFAQSMFDMLGSVPDIHNNDE